MQATERNHNNITNSRIAAKYQMLGGSNPATNVLFLITFYVIFFFLKFVIFFTSGFAAPLK